MKVEGKTTGEKGEKDCAGFEGGNRYSRKRVRRG